MARIYVDGIPYTVKKNKDGQLLINGQIASYKGSSIFQTHSGFFNNKDEPIDDFKEKKISEIVAIIIADNLASKNEEVD